MQECSVNFSLTGMQFGPSDRDYRFAHTQDSRNAVSFQILNESV